MKKERKVWLTDSEYDLLKSKAQMAGYEGKGFLSHYLSYISRFKLIVVDPGLNDFIGLLERIRITPVFKAKKGFPLGFVLLSFWRYIPRPSFTVSTRYR